MNWNDLSIPQQGELERFTRGIEFSDCQSACRRGEEFDIRITCLASEDGVEKFEACVLVVSNDPRSDVNFIAGAPIEIHCLGDGRTHAAITNRFGQAWFRGIPRGEYSVCPAGEEFPDPSLSAQLATVRQLVSEWTKRTSQGALKGVQQEVATAAAELAVLLGANSVPSSSGVVRRGGMSKGPIRETRDISSNLDAERARVPVEAMVSGKPFELVTDSAGIIRWYLPRELGSGNEWILRAQRDADDLLIEPFSLAFRRGRELVWRASSAEIPVYGESILVTPEFVARLREFAEHPECGQVTIEFGSESGTDS